MLRKHLQKAELHWRDRDLDTICVEQFVRLRVQKRQPPNWSGWRPSRPAFSAVRFARRPAQHRLHAREQLPQVDGLGDIVVGADLQADDPVDDFRRAGQHDDGDVGVLAEVSREREAVLAWHPDIENDDIDMLAGNDLAQGRAAVDRRNGKAVDFQILRDSVPYIRLVVADNDMRACRSRLHSTEAVPA